MRKQNFVDRFRSLSRISGKNSPQTMRDDRRLASLNGSFVITTQVAYLDYSLRHTDRQFLSSRVHRCAGLLNILGFANLSLGFRLTSTITSTVSSERINNDFGMTRLQTKSTVAGVDVCLCLCDDGLPLRVRVSRAIFEFCEPCLVVFLFSSSCVELLLPSRTGLLQAATRLRGQHLLHREHAHGQAHRGEHECRFGHVALRCVSTKRVYGSLMKR